MTISKIIFFLAILLIKITFTTTDLSAAYPPFQFADYPPFQSDQADESSPLYETMLQKEIALHRAVQSANTVEVNRLLAENVDPNCIIGGVSPLFHAIEGKNWSLILLLRIYGANPTLPSQRQDQQTPLQFACDLLRRSRYVYVDDFYFCCLNVVRALTQEDPRLF